MNKILLSLSIFCSFVLQNTQMLAYASESTPAQVIKEKKQSIKNDKNKKSHYFKKTENVLNYYRVTFPESEFAKLSANDAQIVLKNAVKIMANKKGKKEPGDALTEALAAFKKKK